MGRRQPRQERREDEEHRAQGGQVEEHRAEGGQEQEPGEERGQGGEPRQERGHRRQGQSRHADPGPAAAGTIAGTQIAEFGSTVTLGSDTTAPQALAGTPSFTPAAGKSYLLLAEIQSNVSDVDGAGGSSCSAYVNLLVNGHYSDNNYLHLQADSSSTDIFGFEPSDSLSTAIGLVGAGAAVTITEVTEGDADCGPGATGQLRGTIVELG